MARKVVCPNPQCEVVFEVDDDMVGQTTYCPQCGSPCDVPAEAMAEAPPEAGQEAAEGQPIHHPARQQCPNCGTVLGVRAAICPECGADIRTGAAAELAEEKRRDLVPILIGAGILVALVVLAGLAWFALKLVSERREAERRQRAEQVKPQQVVTGPKLSPEQLEAQRLRVEESALGELPRLEAAARQAAEDYKARLKELLAETRALRDEQRAARWADLYLFCKENDLPAEADLCWMQAITLEPQDAETNRKLGRTERYRAVPVTAEQKAFLEGLRPSLRVVNRDPELGDHMLRVGEDEPVPFRWSEAAEYEPEPGPLTIAVEPNDPEGVARQFALDIRPGLAYTLTVRSAAAAPTLDQAALVGLFREIAAKGAAAKRPGRQIVASHGGIDARGLQEAALALLASEDGNTVGLAGELTRGNPYTLSGQHILHGDAENRARFVRAVEEDPRRNVFALHRGFYYTVRADLVDPLWKVVGSAAGDFGPEWARRRLITRKEELEFQIETLQARGQLHMPWEADERMRQGMASLHAELNRVLLNQERAAAEPLYLDRCRAFGISEREQHLYLNWPRYRHALAALMPDVQDVVFNLLEQTASTKPEPTEAPAPTRGARGAGPPAGYGPPAGIGGPPAGIGGPPAGYGPPAGIRGTRPAQEAEPEQRDRSPFEPPEVTLKGSDRRYMRTKLMPIMPEDVMLREVISTWGAMDARTRMAALAALELAASPPAVTFLGERSQEARQSEAIAAALLSLGAIGTPEALRYCRSPGILPVLRSAAMAALATAGEAEMLENMAQRLKAAEPVVRANFLAYVTEMETPASVLVLSEALKVYTDQPSRTKIAEALARIGGPTAVGELARLIESTGQPYASALARVRREDAFLLLQPVGRLVVRGQGGGAGVGFLMRQEGPAAFAYLKKAAGEGNETVTSALLEKGTAEAIQAASAGEPDVTVALLKGLRLKWYSPGAAGQPRWRGGVSAEAARGFVRRVLEKAPEPEVKLAAAAMLREMGSPPAEQKLVALAREPTQEAQPGQRGRPGADRAGAAMAQIAAHSGPPAMERSASQFVPKGWQPPAGDPQFPPGLEVNKEDGPLYAIAMLMEKGDAGASAQLRKLAQDYGDTRLKAAAYKALARIGDEQNLQFLRDRATARREEYNSAGHVLNALEDRIAALIALGQARDARTLPHLLDMLHEPAPAEKAIKQPEPDYTKLRSWWEMTLHKAACECIARICRDRQLLELTADAAMQQATADRLLAIIQDPGSPDSELADLRKELQAEAVRAYGRCISSYGEETLLVLRRLLLSIRERGGAAQPQHRAAPSRGPAGRQADEGADLLRNALRDAVVHLAVRGGSPAVLKDLPELLPAPGGVDPHWSSLMGEMAYAPSPRYFVLLMEQRGALRPDAYQAIYQRARGQVSSYDPDYGEFVVMLLRQVLTAQQEDPAAPRARARPAVAGGPPAGTGRPPAGTGRPPAGIGGPPAGIGRPPAGTSGPPAFVEAYRGPMTARGGAEQEGTQPTADYDRRGPHRTVDWSYSLKQVTDRIARTKQHWARVQDVFEGNATAIAMSLTGGLMARSEVGPALGVLCVERVPSAGPNVIAGLGQVLTATARAETAAQGASPSRRRRADDSPPVETRRTAAIALRRLGGEPAAEALLSGLVGPPDPASEPAPQRQAPPAGPPPGAGAAIPRIAGVTPAASAGRAPPGQAALAGLIARALGTMARKDMLNYALAAGDRPYYRQNRTAIQEAALTGMAYLPEEDEPLTMLKGLLTKATTTALRRAVAEALETRLELNAAKS